ncbi:MAG: hypothetical protein AAB955_02030 [Patescibacteria group bacterium]
MMLLLASLTFLASAILAPWYITALLVPLIAPLRYSLAVLILGGALMDVTFGSVHPLYTIVFGLGAIAAEVLKHRALL